MNAALANEEDSRCSETRIRKLSLPCCAPESSPALQTPLQRAINLLEEVDELSRDATGAIVAQSGTKDSGAILVENGRICWAMAPGMKQRLTEVLQHQVSPPIPKARIEELYRVCVKKGRPLGETLISAGLISPNDLRRALRQHTAEAIAIMGENSTSSRFLPHNGRGYEAAFTFSTGALLCSLGALKNSILATKANQRLHMTLPETCTGVVYLRDQGASPTPLAMAGEHEFQVGEIQQLAAWSSSMLDISGALGDSTQFMAASDSKGQAIGFWQEDRLLFTARCPDKSALARVFMGANSR